MKLRRDALAGSLIALGIALAATPAAAQQAPAAPWMNAKIPADERVQMLLAQMTEDEKLTLVFGYFGTDFAPKNGYKAPAEARPGSAGYIPAIPRLGIPAQWQTDAGVGVATQGGAARKRERTALPSGLATTASWDVTLAHAGGAMIGAEARASGFNVMLAGGVNLMREPRNGRNFEYGGEDPLLAGTMVGAQIAGIQSNHIISTVKHYAVNDQETDRDTGNSIIDQAAARMSDLLAFQIAIEKGDPGSVMCSYNRVNGTHACENPWLLTDVLRRDWGYKGYVMSDWGATHSTAPAANAGLDQDSGFPFDKEPYFGAPLKAAVAKGEVSKARLDAMAGAILHGMFANGLFDKPVTEAPMDLAPAMLAAHAEVTRKDAEGGAVLLQNQGAILPLSPAVKKIVVIGGRADKGVLAGSGSSLVYPVGGNAVPGLKPTGWPGPVMYYPDAPLAAIRRQAPNAELVFDGGGDTGSAAKLAKGADVVIVFATQWASESFDVKLSLDDNQDKLIAAVAKANPKTVVVLETGGPVLTPWRGQVAGILATWYPGTQGGSAIANLLFGKVNPSGHLPASFPASLDQLPKPSEPNKGDTSYGEGATVGYKWYDAKGLTPAFAFGHGLSYTSFDYAGLAAKAAGGTVEASFTVKNSGARKGKAVPQLYVAGSGWEAPKRLGAFTKVALAPGEAKKLTLTVDPRLLATFDTASNSWKIAGGTYQVMLGTSAKDIVATVPVTLEARTIAVGWRP
ncbi:glycoside hydrolase family 3 C-terminal domain-containing protein [Sphingomonas sp. HITSZ_GF]|uniref:beta-glucosidase family protein n=1 Tax=Sphingomonas sp. HITSZ_GF TaxID=3037247 RepID=UPI00240CF389|nr:glycoside hydrolase family 3 C-terminal domain-containing protein [Sphingomonas sp. HITSZ_GF]MDG2536012.1 glycoside hydrolase family 3 C-terminal domain-containing protein [Sphingomonas sp. HITSZ_GF]